MIGIHPDCSIMVGKPAWVFENQSAVNRGFGYINGTRRMVICYDGTSTIEVIGFSNLDLSGDFHGKHSTAGYLFMMEIGAISCCSRKQSSFAT